MIEIEALIYAMGSVTLILTQVFVIFQLIHYLTCFLVKKSYKKLSNLYRHYQLEYFMKFIIENGYKEAKAIAEKEEWRAMKKDSTEPKP